MYREFDENASLDQGDIIKNIVLSYIPDISQPSLFQDEDQVEIDLAQPLPESLVILGSAAKSPMMVISQGCDIDHKEFITLARIHTLHDNDYNQMNNPTKKANHIKKNYQQPSIRPYLYYLQESDDIAFPKSFASFLELHTLPKTPNNLSYLIQNRILRLIDDAVGDLQYRIGYFFGRYAVSNDNYMLTPAERALIE
jgi:hypothetical protein